MECQPSFLRINTIAQNLNAAFPLILLEMLLMGGKTICLFFSFLLNSAECSFFASFLLLVALNLCVSCY